MSFTQAIESLHNPLRKMDIIFPICLRLFLFCTPVKAKTAKDTQQGRINILCHFFLLILLVMWLHSCLFSSASKYFPRLIPENEALVSKLLDFCWPQRSHNFACATSGLLAASCVNTMWERDWTSTYCQTPESWQDNPPSHSKVSHLCSYLTKRHFIPIGVSAAASLHVQGKCSFSIAASDMR